MRKLADFQVSPNLGSGDALEIGAQLDAERSLYATPTSLSEVVGQLLSEALAWRKANRPRTSGAFKPPRRVAFQLP